MCQSRRHEARHQLDQVGLSIGARLLEQVSQMGPDRRVGYTEQTSHFRHAPAFDDCRQNARLAARELVETATASSGIGRSISAFRTNTAATAEWDLFRSRRALPESGITVATKR
jgi:hypothetical protein